MGSMHGYFTYRFINYCEQIVHIYVLLSQSSVTVVPTKGQWYCDWEGNNLLEESNVSLPPSYNQYHLPGNWN